MSFADQLGFTFEQAPTRRIWRVADLVSAVRTTVERGYTDVWVEGEISSYRPSESGHLYFTLKDGDAQLRIVMFRSQARLLPAAFPPRKWHAGDCPRTRDYL
jgi:exodeoxyribonuclease VII large subunit